MQFWMTGSMEKEVVSCKERIPGDEDFNVIHKILLLIRTAAKEGGKVFFILTSVACAVGPSVTTSSTDFSFQNLGFWNLFSSRNHLKFNISHHLNPKSYQINSIKSCSSIPFQQHQRHIPLPPKFSATIWFKIQWRNHSYSRTFALHVQMPWNQAHAPLLLESFPKRPRRWFEASSFGESHKYKTKQTNYLSS